MRKLKRSVRLTAAVAVTSLLLGATATQAVAGKAKGKHKDRSAETTQVEATTSFEASEPSAEQPAEPPKGQKVAPTYTGDPVCDRSGIGQRFLDWGDLGYYVPVAGGSFESGAEGWEIGKGASLTRNGNPYGTEGYAIALGSGGSVTSPSMCVHLDYPVARMFAKKEQGKDDAYLEVEVLYTKADSSESKTKVSELAGPEKWDATEPWKLPNERQLGLTDDRTYVSGDAVEVQFRFTAPHGSKWKIDDVFLDPRMRR